MKAQNNNSQQLRTQIQHLVTARQSLQKNVDISGSMVKTIQTLNHIKPLLNKQTEFIKTFLQGNQDNEVGGKESETRRYISRICDITLNQMTEIFTVAETFFTIEMKTTWTKIRNQFQKKLLSERELIDKTNPIQFLFKIINIKEKIMKEFVRSLIYRKCLLWKDLNIVNSGFVHSQKKKITKTLQDYITAKNYAPTKPVFTLPDFEIAGQWSLNKHEVEDSSISQFLTLLNEEVEEIFNTIRNYSGLNEEQRANEDIKRNIVQVKSLRAEIEQVNINYLMMERKYREAVSKDQKIDIIQMKDKLKLAEDALEAKELELRELKYNSRDFTRDLNTQKEKVKQLEADLQKINNIEMKKLKEIQILQTNLQDEFNRIHKNMSSFGSMFEFESDGKKSLANQIISLKATIQKMAIILGKHKIKNNELNQQIKRLNIIILQLGGQLRQQREQK